MRNNFFILCVLLLVEGVSGDEKVTVMEGDSVTLNPDDVEIQRDDEILWKFNDLVITADAVPERFRDRLKLDQTGSLTITNITNTDSGLYTLKISKSTEEIFKDYTVTVRDEMKTVSVTEGEPIILYTGLIEIRGYDLILWKFGDHLIAEINKGNNLFLSHDSSDERFKGRLQPREQSGSLTIRDSRTTDSGDYHLNMSSSSHSLQRTISVTVSVSDKPTPDPGLSPGAVVAWVVVVVLLLVLVAGGIYHRRKISELKGRRDLEKNGTNDPLKTETADRDVL